MEGVSIIIPAYNEEKTLPKIAEKLLSLDLGIKKEIIFIDDGSTDRTLELAKKYESRDVKVIHKENGGKGSAVKLGIKNSEFGIILIQDADLEYNPENIRELIKPIISKKYDVVYGSRFLGRKNKGIPMYYLGNRVLSFVTSVLYNQKITDMETCYKVFRKKVLEDIAIMSDGFDFEPEITAKILKRGYKIKEIPIDYFPRSKSDGKKIRARDGLTALGCLIRYRFF